MHWWGFSVSRKRQNPAFSPRRAGYALVAYGLLGSIALSPACNPSHDAGYRPSYTKAPGRTNSTYILGVHPLHNPKRLHAIFGPIADYLSAEIPGATFKLEGARDYAAYDAKLYARRFHFALPNPYQTVNALRHGYRVFGKMGDDQNFRGIILVRKDAAINSVADLNGKAISFPAPTALAATMMPQQYLVDQGLNVMRDVDIRYVGSQESSIMNVYLGNVSAAATWPPPWRALAKERPEIKDALQVKWSTSALPNNGLVVRDDVPDEITKQVAKLLFSLHTHPQGQALLEPMELSRFEVATDDTYDPVIRFLKTFDKMVRPIEHE